MAAGFRDIMSLIVHWWNAPAVQQPTAPGMEWTLESMQTQWTLATNPMHFTLAKNDFDWTLPEED